MTWEHLKNMQQFSVEFSLTAFLESVVLIGPNLRLISISMIRLRIVNLSPVQGLANKYSAVSARSRVKIFFKQIPASFSLGSD